MAAVRWGVAGVAFIAVMAVGAAETQPDAARVLAAHLAALKDTKNLQASFVCQKNLVALETPLTSQGRLWIRRGDSRDGEGALRFSTEKPYVSELILARGKVLVRSQHEHEWTKTNQSSRPGITAIMGQLGGWSTGEPGKIAEMYTIGANSDPIPESPGGAKIDATTDGFTLTPVNADLMKVIKKLTLAVDHASHHLLFIEILTQQGDTTRYWFSDLKTNVELPADIFTPAKDPPVTQPAGKQP